MEFHSMRDCDAWRKQNLRMSTTSNECCKLYDAALTQYVKWHDSDTYGGLEKTLEDMTKCDENFVLGSCLKRGLELIGTSSEPSGLNYKYQLLEFNDLIKRVDQNLTKRELKHAQAIQCLYKDDIITACNLWEDILVEYPTDMLAIKFAHDSYFYLGYHSQMRDSVARVLPNWNESIPLYGSLYGIYSFGLVQSNYFEQAKAVASKALEMNRSDGWATHSLCHYYEYSTDYNSGIDFLNKTESDWSICNILSSHNYWHLALYHIEKSEHEVAMELYKNHISNNLSLDRTLDMVDAISLLYRLKLDSCTIPLEDEWKEIARVYTSRCDNHAYIFNDSHIAMMLSESGDKEGEHLFDSSLNAYLNDDSGAQEISIDFFKKLNGQLADKIFKAIFLFRSQEFAQVFELLYPIRYEIVKIGGSNAQRDLFQQTLIQAALRSESKLHNCAGLALLNERRALKPNSTLTERIASRYT